ncbi:MAG: chorismate pyruvate-lyase family protein [Caldilineaceae bacterium]
MFISTTTNGTTEFPYYQEIRSSDVFDPFRDLLAPHATRPPHLLAVDLRTLTPFQRALVSIDGTVTKFIEAYTLEPVESTRLVQQTQRLPLDHPWLELPMGAEVVARQVLLRGRYSATVYAYAVSLLSLERLPANLLHDLVGEPAGLGRVLFNSQIENRRELLWYGRERITDLPIEICRYTGNEFISRTYRIIAAGQPLMLINECFPVDEGHGLLPSA